MAFWDKKEKTRSWDVGADGEVTPLKRSRLESDVGRPGMPQTPAILEKMGTGGTVAAYAGIGSVLALLWGSGGVLGFMTNVALWPIILGLKVLSAIFWPVVLMGAAAGGALWWFKGRQNNLPPKND